MRITILQLCVSLLAASTASAQDVAGKDKKEAERFQSAVAVLDSSDKTQDLLEAMKTLREGFPASRSVLVESAKIGSIRVKCFAIQVLGEKGDAKNDLGVVVPALKDQTVKVRLTAVMALRRLGKEAYEHLTAYLPGEKDPNNRKMAVKTLQEWDAKESVPLLVRLLKKEKEQSVRNFIVRALEGLTKRKRGDDVAAWEAVVDDQAVQAQAKALANQKPEKIEGK